MKKLNKKGFMVAGVVYSILLLFVIIVAALLTLLSNRKNILDSTNDKLKGEMNDNLEGVSPGTDEPGTQPDTSHDSSLPSITVGNPIELGEASQSMIDTITNADNIKRNNNAAGTVDYRYNGPDVKNYVTFSDETWRIIGLVNGRVKIIRNDSIGDKPWDSNNLNNWNTATLKTYLNGEYYQSLIDKNMVEETTYNLGGIDTTNKTVDEIYAMENGTKVYNGHPEVSDSIHIALMYPSDYGYSMKTGDGFCESKPVNYDSGDECKVNGTWLYKGTNEWLLAPFSGFGYRASNVSSSGYLNKGSNVNISRSVRPSLYLKSSVKIAGGEGTINNPYTLSEE